MMESFWRKIGSNDEKYKYGKWDIPIFDHLEECVLFGFLPSNSNEQQQNWFIWLPGLAKTKAINKNNFMYWWR